MLDLLLKNVIIIKPDNLDVIDIVNLGIVDSKINYIGKLNKSSMRIIDCKNCVVIPAFFNMHIHFGEYFLKYSPCSLSTYKYILEGENFARRNKKYYRIIRSSSIDNTILESIKMGTLTFFGMRGWPNALRFPANMYLGYPLMKSNKLAEYIEDFEEKFNLLQRFGDGEYFIGLHSVQWVDENILKRLATFMKNNKKIKLSLHICETEDEIRFVSEMFGMTPVQVLLKYGLLNSRTLLVHCNYLTDVDIKLISKANSTVVVCHESNINLKNKPCDINKLINNKINVVVGTDGPPLCKTLSILDACKLSSKLFNVEITRVLDMATVNAAKFLGLKSV